MDRRLEMEDELLRGRRLTTLWFGWISAWAGGLLLLLEHYFCWLLAGMQVVSFHTP
jgi:hypothetical protein